VLVELFLSISSELLLFTTGAAAAEDLLSLSELISLPILELF